jgi:predicted transcriptional regulator
MQKETQEISTKRKSGEPFRQASTMQERMRERERERERDAISSPQKIRNQIDPIPKQRSKGEKKETKDKKTKNNALRLSSFAIWKLDERNSLDDAGRI